MRNCKFRNLLKYYSEENNTAKLAMLRLRAPIRILQYCGINAISPKRSRCFLPEKLLTAACTKTKAPFSALMFTANQHKASCIHTSSIALKGKVIPFLLSDIGEGLAEVQIKEWYVKEGDVVKQFDDICEAQSDKATVVITSRYDGIIHKIYNEVDDFVKVGSPLVDIFDENAEEKDTVKQQTKVEESKVKTTEKKKTATAKPLVTPAVRKIASDNNIDITSIKGSGKDGRVLKEDVLWHMKGDRSIEDETSQAEANDEIVQVTGYRRAMVKTMTKSGSVPQFGYCDEVRMDAVMRLREKIKEMPQYSKMTFMPFMIKALSHALMSYPELNAIVSDIADYITYKASHNIGVAVDTQGGLIVPNIKHVQAKNILEVSKELKRLTDLAHQGKLGPDDTNGGTFTISNIGNIGGTYTKPLLLPPEVAIGGFGRILPVPKYSETGEIVKGYVMNVSWSADHRVIDGALLARFSNLWRSYLESPELLILDLK
ncbi:lipoamide acyltransferase component of branched-chain alpha-keto acid dehydrogenase complex, mitochondrial-like [Dysidea avara]|uniref:lipoamide acyltransferase component of branched-chain alpha-keto acid dehydrogenase complex, mitochondrial-like n=1 Tax=Dysidea avara TaxID=196820 RepID=UPI003327173C